MTKLYLLATFAFFLFIILDLAWFSIAGNFFKGEIGSIARLTVDGAWNVRYIPAAIAYILMAVGVAVFVLPHTGTLGAAALYGALFGLIAFGLYDMTNLATLSAWTVKFALVDMAWGTFVCSTVSMIVYMVGSSSWLA